MPQDNIAPISFCAIHRGIVLEYVLGGIRRLIGEHAAITADDLHLEIALLDLAVLSITKASEGRKSVRIQLPAFMTSIRVWQVGVCFFEMSIEVFKIDGSVVLGVPHTVSTTRSRPAVIHGPLKVVEAGAWGSVFQVADALGAASSR
ncbi:hypothetical protein HG531_003002 [Fusarium graminearum]|nr:hypothetical protein HG531_003002 [Fusarium graminearum]